MIYLSVMWQHNVIHGYDGRVITTGAENVSAYRRHFLARDARTLSFVLCCALLFHTLWIRSDHLLLRGTDTFHWMCLFRAVLIGFSCWTLVIIQRTNSPEIFDRWTFSWAMTCALASPLISLSRPATYTGHQVMELVIIMVLYAIQPGRLLLRIIPPLTLSCCSLLFFFTHKVTMGYVASLSTILAYFGANTIGWLIASSWFRYRKEAFLANQALERHFLQAEAGRLAAEASERTWERIIDTSPNMLYVVDTTYRIRRVNQTFVNRLGISRDEVLGRHCHELLCGSSIPPEKCLLRKVVDHQHPRIFEARFPPFDIDCRMMTAPLFDQAGCHEATVFIVQDISEQKQTERDLIAAQEMYRSLVQNSHGVIFRIQPDGILTYLSPSYSTLMGIHPETVIGKHFRAVVHPDDINTCEAYQREILTSLQGRNGVEYRVRHNDGSLRWHLANFTPCFDEYGGIHSFVGNAIDITELKQTQFALNTALESAESASTVKSEFLAMISHEIRTPLNAMVGYSNLARRTTDPVLLQNYLEILDRSSQSLMDLVNNILDMSRAEAGQLQLEAHPFNLPEAIDLLQWLYAPVASGKSIAFQVNKDQSLPVWVNGDSVRFRQIVGNLLSNAIKFTEQGRVALTAKVQERDGHDGSLTIRLDVEDTGAGIETDKLPLLFQPFVQIHSGTARQYGGSGLGLAIVKRLVDMMQGRIEVHSLVGEGCRFTVYLPFLPANPPQYTEVKDSPTDSLIILVVDDNDFNRTLLGDTLRGWGNQVTEAACAQDAVELFTNTTFDCVILDIRMPDIDGLELARRLRAIERHSHLAETPIIAYTADKEGTTKEQCLQAGIGDVLFKPLNPRLLAVAIGQYDRQAKISKEQPAKAVSFDNLDKEIHGSLVYDNERMQEYVRLLHGDIESELQRLARAVAGEDRQEIEAAAHSLKGLCCNLDDKRLAELASRLHKCAQIASVDELHHLVGQLLTLAQQESKPLAE